MLAVLQELVEAIGGLLPSASTNLFGLVLPEGWLYGYSVLNHFLPVSELLAAGAVLLGLRLVVFQAKLLLMSLKMVAGAVGL